MSSNYRDFAPMLSNSYDHVRPKNETERRHFDKLVRQDYNRAHPDDCFDDMKQRASFSPEDQGLYRDWLAVAACRAKAVRAEVSPLIAAE